MPEPLTSDIIDFHYSCYAYSAILQNLYNDVLSLQTGLIADGSPTAAAAAGNMAVHVWEMRNKFTYGSDSVRYWLVKCLQYIDNNAFNGGGGVVDMASILTAMRKATPDERQEFIAIVDGFRASIWNKRYDELFYANLAREFIYG